VNSRSNIIELPNLEHNECFGCGSENYQGLKMKFFAENKKVFSRITLPSYVMGWNGVVHGGIVSTLLDEIMGWSAIYLTQKFIFTKTMTVNYHKPVMVGDPLYVEGCIMERTSEREAVMKGDLYNGKGELAASSVGTFALMDPEYVKKMKIMSDSDIDEFTRIIDAAAGLEKS